MFIHRCATESSNEEEQVNYLRQKSEKGMRSKHSSRNRYEASRFDLIKICTNKAL